MDPNTNEIHALKHRSEKKSQRDPKVRCQKVQILRWNSQAQEGKMSSEWEDVQKVWKK